jgi:hypothetical protein
MTFQSLPGEILGVSPQAKRVLSAAGRKLRAKPKTTPRRSDLATTTFRAGVAKQLLAGANPHHWSPDLIEELEAADPAVGRAVTAWYAARVPR